MKPGPACLGLATERVMPGNLYVSARIEHAAVILELLSDELGLKCFIILTSAVSSPKSETFERGTLAVTVQTVSPLASVLDTIVSSLVATVSPVGAIALVNRVRASVVVAPLSTMT